jgi:proteic killer suppression protein
MPMMLATFGRSTQKSRLFFWVNGSWRMTFEFRDGHAYILDYEDYHG